MNALKKTYSRQEIELMLRPTIPSGYTLYEFRTAGGRVLQEFHAQLLLEVLYDIRNMEWVSPKNEDGTDDMYARLGVLPDRITSIYVVARPFTPTELLCGPAEK